MRILKKSIIPLIFLLITEPSSKAELPAPLDGFASSSSVRQRELEKMLTATLKPENAEAHLKWLTSRPHRAGTEGARITAEYIKERLLEYGLPAQIETYQAYLPEPVSVSLELQAPVREIIPTTEDRIQGDVYTENVKEHPGWNGYSPSGEAIGEVVYANHGSESDLMQIQSLGIDLKGKILLMRYFGTGEGTKVANAEKFGAAGVVLYADPAEDGYRYGDVYPKGNWRPPGAIMRRSIIPPMFDGDPLSPGWASRAGAKRLQPQEVNLPKIPVLPVSYRSAEKILNLLNGPVAPYNMQGALPLPYKFGPGPAKLRMKTEMDNRDRPMLNVMSRIEGEMYPDQWIIVGNHHDAWIYGAGDPSSGTASLLEFARGLGLAMRQGYRPKRTLILAFWDAEEMLLGGSTEWVEDHQEELLKKAIACINMDSSVFNTDRPLSVSAHPVLHQIFREASKNIKDPKTKKTMFEAWVDLQNQYRQTPSVDGWGEFFEPNQELKQPWIFESPSDDAAPFFHQLALPASDMYYGADYGMYHSIYENFHWMKTIVDPTFEYHIAMALLQGFVTLRLANADLIPLDYTGEASYWKMAYQSLAESAREKGTEIPMMEQSMELIQEWEKEAVALQNKFQELLSNPTPEFLKDQAQKLNQNLFLIARDFYRKEGAPGAKLERNMWSGSEGILPGLRFALSSSDQDILQNEANLYLKALKKRVESLRAIQSQTRLMN